ncbi:MAG: hypothetical protein QM802_03740 [Agriterribacter sp.]
MKYLPHLLFVIALFGIAGFGNHDTLVKNIKDHTNYIDLTIDGVAMGRYGNVGDVVSIGPNGDKRGGGFSISQGGMMMAISSYNADDTKTEGIFFQLLIKGATGVGTYKASGEDPDNGVASISIRNRAGAFSDPDNFSYYTADANFARTKGSCFQNNPQKTEGMTIEYTSWGTKRGEITTGSFHGVFYENARSQASCRNSERHTFSGTFKFAFQ